jgi:hypothetical protein
MITRRSIASSSQSSTSRNKNADRGNTSREALFPFLFPRSSATLSTRRSWDRCLDKAMILFDDLQ